MWRCRFCGSDQGMFYQDTQLEGMLCLAPDCGRFNDIQMDENIDFYESDI